MNKALHTDFDSVAVLTSLGILFRGRNYSCSLAISEQWFATVENQDAVNEFPIVHSEDNENVYIMLENNNLVPVFLLSCVCKHSEDELNSYFQKINELKQKLVKKKSKYVGRL